MTFEYDFHKDIRVDVAPNNLIVSIGNQPVNYQQSFRDNIFAAKLHTEMMQFSISKLTNAPIRRKKTGLLINPHIQLCKIFPKEYTKRIKSTYYKARNQVIGQDPAHDLSNYYCAQYGTYFKKKVLLDDVNKYGFDLNYLKEAPYRCWVMECDNIIDKGDFITKLESQNPDFLHQAKWIINPQVLFLLANYKNVPLLRKSHILTLSYVFNKTGDNLFDKFLNMSDSEFLKAKKLVEKKMGRKLDFRKYMDIKNFVHYYPDGKTKQYNSCLLEMYSSITNKI